MKKAIISICLILYAFHSFSQLNIVDLIPSQNSNTASPNDAITAVFSESIVSGTVTNDAFVVRGSISGLITGEVVGDDSDVLIFTPDNPLQRGEVVTVTITDGFVASNFFTLSEDFTYEFRVAGALAPEDPMVFLENEVENGSNTFATVGDIDSDGDTDILSLSSTFNIGVSWLENDGNGNFSNAIPIDGTATQANEALIFDKEYDGDVDILYKTTNSVSWLENDGNENFTSYDLPFDFATTGAINSVHYITTNVLDGPAVIIAANNGLFISTQWGGGEIFRLQLI